LKPQKKRTFSFRLPPPPQNTLLYHLTFNLINSNQGYDSFYSFNCESDAPQVLRSPEQEPKGGKAQAVRRYQEGQRS